MLHGDRLFVERLRLAAAKDFAWLPVERWSDLRLRLRDASPSALAVVDPYLGTPRSGGPSPDLRALLLEFPSTSVVVALEVRAGRGRDLCVLGHWGVCGEVIDLAADNTVQAVRQRLRQVRGRPLRRAAEHTAAFATPRGRSILLAAAEVALKGGNVQALCRMLYASRRTVDRWCVDAGLPPPRRVLLWMRMMLAAELLEDPGRTVEGVALACGYSSNTALHRALQELTGVSPGKIREEGALAVVGAAMSAELSPKRHPDHGPEGNRTG